MRLQWSVGCRSGPSPKKGTARGYCALCSCAGAALWGHAKLGTWGGEQQSQGKSPSGATPVLE